MKQEIQWCSRIAAYHKDTQIYYKDGLKKAVAYMARESDKSYTSQHYYFKAVTHGFSAAHLKRYNRDAIANLLPLHIYATKAVTPAILECKNDNRTYIIIHVLVLQSKTSIFCLS